MQLKWFDWIKYFVRFNFVNCETVVYDKSIKFLYLLCNLLDNSYDIRVATDIKTCAL